MAAEDEFKYKAYLRKKERPQLPKSTYYRWLNHYEKLNANALDGTDDRPRPNNQGNPEPNQQPALDTDTDTPSEPLVDLLPVPESDTEVNKSLSVSPTSTGRNIEDEDDDINMESDQNADDTDNDGDYADNENTSSKSDETWQECLCATSEIPNESHDIYDTRCSKRICLDRDAEKSFQVAFEEGPAVELGDFAEQQHDENNSFESADSNDNDSGHEAGDNAVANGEENQSIDDDSEIADLAVPAVAVSVNETVIAGHEMMVNNREAAEENQLREIRLNRFLEDLGLGDDFDEEQFRQQIQYYEDEDSVNISNAESFEDEIFANNQGNLQDHGDDQDDRNYDREENDSPLFDGAGVTKGQAQVLLLSYIFKHDVSDQQLEDFCKIMDVLFPGILPKSAYLFKKGIPEIKGVCRYYLYCCNCAALIGLSDTLEDDGECTVCNQQFSKKKSFAKGNYFIVFPMKEQIQSVLERCKVAQIRKPADFANTDNCFDLVSGECLKRMFAENKISATDFTALWNFDGVPVFNSTDFSIWPLQFTINELSYHERKKNVLMYGLWFGDKKPKCNTFLQPLKEEAEKLGEEGLTWRNPVTEENINSRFFFTTATCDAVARPIVRNCTQFNGRFGCDWCLHEGQRVQRGRGYTNSYPFLYPEPEQRTHEDTVESGVEMDLALINDEERHPICGVKGSTYLSLLPNFDLVQGFVVDYMHCVLLGVTRQLTTLWFDSSYHDRQWYIGTYTDQVDELILAVKPPSEITRCPRPLTQRKLWKASEWRTFLLYTSPVVLKHVLDDRYYDHLLLLSTSIYELLKESLSPDQIDNAEVALKKFCIQVGQLYGVEHASFNIHQLTHICDCVRRWGPLFVTSAFPFESNNHSIMKLFKGKRYPALQISRKFTMKKGLEAIAKDRMEYASDKVKHLFERLVHSGRYLPQREIRVGQLYLYGKPATRNLGLEEFTAAQQLLGDLADVPCKHYLRFSNGKFCCYSCEYQRGEKHEDDVVLIEGGRYCKVKEAVLLKVDCRCDDECNCEVQPVVILVKYRALRSRLFFDRQLGIGSDHIVQLHGTTDTIAVHPNVLRRKCFVVAEGDTKYAIGMPNNFETD